MKNSQKAAGGIKGNSFRGILTLALVVILWCVISYGGFVDELFVPSPTAVLQEMISGIKNGSLLLHCGASIRRVMVGWFWSAVIALPCGMLMARSKSFSALIQPLIEFVRYLPVVALVPLTILYLGIGERQKYVIIWLGTFFQLVLMVYDTVSSVDKTLLNVSLTLGANKAQVYFDVILPAALPGLMDDFRLTIGWAWTYLVVAEMIAASSGLGYMILKSQRFLATDVIFMGLIMIGLIGLATDFLLRVLTKLIVPWYKRLGD